MIFLNILPPIQSTWHGPSSILWACWPIAFVKSTLFQLPVLGPIACRIRWEFQLPRHASLGGQLPQKELILRLRIKFKSPQALAVYLLQTCGTQGRSHLVTSPPSMAALPSLLAKLASGASEYGILPIRRPVGVISPLLKWGFYLHQTGLLRGLPTSSMYQGTTLCQYLQKLSRLKVPVLLHKLDCTYSDLVSMQL